VLQHGLGSRYSLSSVWACSCLILLRAWASRRVAAALVGDVDLLPSFTMSLSRRCRRESALATSRFRSALSSNGPSRTYEGRPTTRRCASSNWSVDGVGLESLYCSNLPLGSLVACKVGLDNSRCIVLADDVHQPTTGINSKSERPLRSFSIFHWWPPCRDEAFLSIAAGLRNMGFGISCCIWAWATSANTDHLFQAI
jgi:hypothetical protein